MSSELLATYAGLGTHDGERYYKGEECLACVKDLIRALRGDDTRCEIRRQLGQARVLQKDLLAILVNSADDHALRNDVIRLLVNLTQPAYLCFSGALPKGKDSDAMRCYMEVEKYLRGYKEAFTVESVMNVLGSVLANLCQKDWDHRDDDDIIIIERILLLIRNILHVTPDTAEEKRTEDDVTIHDQVIWNLHINGMDELLLFLGSNSDETQWCMHVLEIFFLMFREQSPSVLANTGKGRSAEERKRDEDLVDEALARERERKSKSLKMRSTRHSRFGGTFVVKNQRSISGSERVYHRPLAGLKDYSYDVEKRPRRTNKNKRPAVNPPKDRLSTYSIRVVLKNLSVQFLECCYNPLMKVVRDNIRHNRAMENDDTYYLWALRFFMEFCRCHDFRVDIVGETLQLGTFHYIIQLTATYYESMVLEKRDLPVARQWAQRLHYALQGYHELLLYMHQMSTSENESLKEGSKVMLGNLVYHQEYRDVFVSLLRNYNEVMQTRSFLCDLVEATHLYIRMMEHYCRGNKHMVVQQKKKKKKGKGKKKKRSQTNSTGYIMTQDQMIDLWERVDGRVGELMEGVEPLPDSVIPFDAASNEPMEEQKIMAMARIRAHLIDANHPEAVALLRAARVVWPNDVFGGDGMSVEEEMDTIKSILFNPAAAIPAARLIDTVEDGEDADEEEEEEEEVEGEVEVQSYETEFEIRKYIQRFTSNKIIHAYFLILTNYRNNSSSVNHAVVKMLYRIAVDLKMAPLLHQISIFRIMLAILEEPSAGRFSELQKFCRYIVAGFFHMASKNPLVFVELLLWKTSRDVFELTEGYGTVERERERKQMSMVWTREQEEELSELFQRYKDEDDVVACIMAGLPQDIPRSRKQVVKQLVNQELVGSAKELTKKQPAKKKTTEWTEEEEALLKEVFQMSEEGGEEKEVIKRVAGYFPERGVRNVAMKLRELGMVAGKRRKKHQSSADVDDDIPSTEKTGSSDARGGKKGTKAKRGRSDPKKMPKKKTSQSVPRLVRTLCCHGYSEQLAWLEAYLSDEARDRTMDDEWEEMCIVPVSESVSKAFHDLLFRDLLSSLHLQPPTNTEVYWRIPASMSPWQLTAAVQSLRPSAVNEEKEEEEEEEKERDGEEEEEEEEEQEEEIEEEKEGEGKEEEEEEVERVSTVAGIMGEEKNDEEDEEGEMDEQVRERGSESEGEISSASDVELVIDYGGKVSRSEALSLLISKRKGRANTGPPHPDEAEPQPKKPRLSRANFLDSDSEEEEERGADSVKPLLQHKHHGADPPDSHGCSSGGRRRQKLAVDSDSDMEEGEGGTLMELTASTGERGMEDGARSCPVMESTGVWAGSVDRLEKEAGEKRKEEQEKEEEEGWGEVEQERRGEVREGEGEEGLQSPVMDTVELMGHSSCSRDNNDGGGGGGGEAEDFNTPSDGQGEYPIELKLI